MKRRRGTPDRRGMGAQSDFISESFVPGAEHHERQLTMAQALLRSGLDPVQVAGMLSLPLELLRPKTASS